MTQLTLAALRAANTARLPRFRNAKGEAAHAKPDGSDWTPADWIVAVVGEVGEMANVAKKVRRGDLSMLEARPKLRQELSDVVIYLDLLAMQWSIDLDGAVVETFNAKSDQVGAPVYLRARPSGYSVEDAGDTVFLPGQMDWTIKSFAEGEDNDFGWDQETGKPGIGTFGNAVQVWAMAQGNRDVTVADAAAAFRVAPELMRAAIEAHAYMLVGIGDVIEHDGD